MILVWVAVPFVIGVVLGAGAGVPGAITLTLAAGLAFFGLTRGKRRRTLFLAAAALCVGVWRAPSSADGVVDTSLNRYHGAVELQGVVSAEPDIRDTGANYDVSVHQVTVHAQTFASGGTVRVHTSSSQQLAHRQCLMLPGIGRVVVGSRRLIHRPYGVAQVLARVVLCACRPTRTASAPGSSRGLPPLATR